MFNYSPDIYLLYFLGKLHNVSNQHFQQVCFMNHSVGWDVRVGLGCGDRISWLMAENSVFSWRVMTYNNTQKPLRKPGVKNPFLDLCNPLFSNLSLYQEIVPILFFYLFFFSLTIGITLNDSSVQHTLGNVDLKFSCMSKEDNNTCSTILRVIVRIKWIGYEQLLAYKRGHYFANGYMEIWRFALTLCCLGGLIPRRRQRYDETWRFQKNGKWHIRVNWGRCTERKKLFQTTAMIRWMVFT